MDKFKIRARLVLAQQLLEESDALPAGEGYTVDTANSTVHHSRHEREAVVNYLLLTCFDLLGQAHKHLTFNDWIISTKPHILEQHKSALEGLDVQTIGIIESTRVLLNHYNRLYGATKAFFAGINGLPAKARTHLLNSVSAARRDPESLKPENKNTSYPPLPIDDKDQEAIEKLKIKMLYSLRNAFTHDLAQMHFSSNPMMAQVVNKNRPNTKGASWGVSIFENKVLINTHQVYEKKYVYDLRDWPFVLFEVLYAAINEEFERTQIKLNMYIFDPYKGSTPSIAHTDLPEILEKKYGVMLDRWYP